MGIHMNERDKELADEAEAYADRDFKGEINWAEAYESKLIALIRADEREACAQVCEALDPICYDTAGYTDCAAAIRARGNT
jgi:hypothetical protein